MKMKLLLASAFAAALLAISPAQSQVIVGGGATGGGGSGCSLANPTATIGASAVNGSAITCMRSDAAPALPSTLPALNGSNLTALNASNLSTGTVAAARGGAGTINGALKANGSGVVSQAACADLSNGAASCSTDTTNAANISSGVLASARGGAGTVNGIMKANGSGTTSAAVSGTDYAPATSGSAILAGNGSGGFSNATMGSCLSYSGGTLGSSFTTNIQTGTTYTVQASDLCKLIVFTSASSVAVTLPDVGTLGTNFAFDVQVRGAGTVTITRQTSSTINGGTSIPIAQNQGCSLVAATNWEVSACTALGSGAGTVTSVALSAPNNAACSVSGSPVTSSGTLTCTPSGTSGGVPYFSASNQLASSSALTANAPVIGGGAGVAPSVGTKSGNTTAFVTTTGTQTNGRCVEIDSNGNHVAAAAACGGGGGSSGFAHPGYVTNFYYTTPTNALADFNVTANRLYAIPFIAGASDTMTKISIRVKGSVASSACEIGVYANSSGRPGSLVEDSGNVATTSTGQKEITGRSISITAGSTYWLAVGCNNAVGLRATDTYYNNMNQWLIGTDDPDGSAMIYGSWTYSVGGLPGTFPTVVTDFNKTPLVYLRK